MGGGETRWLVDLRGGRPELGASLRAMGDGGHGVRRPSWAIPVGQGGEGWVGEVQYGVEEAVHSLYWRMWGWRGWYHSEPSSRGVGNGGSVLSARAGGALPLL